MDRTPPRFDALEGIAEIDYSNHDGIAILGPDPNCVVTQWSRAGEGVVYLLGDHRDVEGIALADDGSTFSEVGATVPGSLNTSSRVRDLYEGDIGVILAKNGAYAVVEVLEVRAREGRGENDWVRFRYRVVGSRRQVEDSAIASGVGSEIRDKVSTILAMLDQQPDGSMDGNAPSIGHNNPPQEIPGTPEFRELVTEALHEVERQIADEHLNKTALTQAVSQLREAASYTLKWIARKLDIAADEFAGEIGRNLAKVKTWVFFWLTFTVELESIVELASRLF